MLNKELSTKLFFPTALAFLTFIYICFFPFFVYNKCIGERFFKNTLPPNISTVWTYNKYMLCTPYLMIIRCCEVKNVRSMFNGTQCVCVSVCKREFNGFVQFACSLVTDMCLFLCNLFSLFSLRLHFNL